MVFSKESIPVVLFLAIPGIAFAGPLSEGTSYAGGQFASATYDEDNVDDDWEPTAIVGRFGYFVADYFSVEGRIGLGLSDDAVTFNTVNGPVDVSVEIDRLVGGYGVGHLPLGDKAALYGLAGFTEGKLTASANGSTVSDTDSGFSLGVGGEFYPNEQFGLNVEYTRYLDESGYEITALSAGATARF